VSSTRFEYPRVHPLEDLYMQLYGSSFTRLYKQSGRQQDVLGHKTACTSLSEDEHLGCSKYVEDTIIELKY
jgi:hypothetical protein